MEAKDYIKLLGLLPHPEGGYYKETYRSVQTETFDGFKNLRNISTGIYFLLETGNFSALHKIKSDEMWHFYTGDALEVIEITKEGQLIITEIGKDLQNGQSFQYVVKAGHWFGSRVKKGGKFSLVGCTVAPGFDFNDFEMGNRSELINLYPLHKFEIEQLTR